MAKVAEDYFDSSARKTETHLGWGRQSIGLGLAERRSRIRCQDNYRARGNHRTEQKQSALEAAIRDLVDGQAQADPQMKTTFFRHQRHSDCGMVQKMLLLGNTRSQN